MDFFENEVIKQTENERMIKMDKTTIRFIIWYILIVYSHNVTGIIASLHRNYHSRNVYLDYTNVNYYKRSCLKLL